MLPAAALTPLPLRACPCRASALQQALSTPVVATVTMLKLNMIAGTTVELDSHNDDTRHHCGLLCRSSALQQAVSTPVVATVTMVTLDMVAEILCHASALQC